MRTSFEAAGCGNVAITAASPSDHTEEFMLNEDRDGVRRVAEVALEAGAEQFALLWDAAEALQERAAFLERYLAGMRRRLAHDERMAPVLHALGTLVRIENEWLQAAALELIPREVLSQG